MKLNCPLCDTPIRGAYTTGVMAIRTHMLQEHIDPQFADVAHPCILCPCGKHFRGLSSFIRHLLHLTEGDRRGHVTLFALGERAIVEERVWGHAYDR